MYIKKISLILQFQFICGFPILLFKNDISFVKKSIEEKLYNEFEFKKLEKKLEYNISFIKPLLSDLIKNNELNSGKSLNFIVNKDLSLTNIVMVQEQIINFEKDFLKTRNIWKLLKFTDYHDFNVNLKIIDDFLIKNKVKSRKFLYETKNSNSELIYKKYVKEVEFNKFKVALDSFFDDLAYIYDVILEKFNDFKIALQKFDKLIQNNDINNKEAKGDINEIDLYKEDVEEFLYSYKSFCTIFNHKNENSEENSEKYSKSKMLRIFKTIIGSEEFSKIKFKDINTNFKIVIDFLCLYKHSNLKNIIGSFCESNKKIFSEKIKIEEILIKEINEKLEKFNSLCLIFYNYLNTEDHKKRKEMEISFFKNINSFLITEYFNNEYPVYNYLYFKKRIFKDSDLKIVFDMLNNGFNYENVNITQLHNFKKYEHVFLLLIFNMFRKIGFSLLSQQSSILICLKNDKNATNSFKNTEYIISKLVELKIC